MIQNSIFYGHIFEFADDSVIVSVLDKNSVVLGPIVQDFAEWCKQS